MSQARYTIFKLNCQSKLAGLSYEDPEEKIIDWIDLIIQELVNNPYFTMTEELENLINEVNNHIYNF
jgi:hypothetical protein